MNQMLLGLFLLSGGLIATTVGGLYVQQAWKKMAELVPAEIGLVNRDGVLHARNYGGDAESLAIYVTRYTLDQESFGQKKIELKDYNLSLIHI